MRSFVVSCVVMGLILVLFPVFGMVCMLSEQSPIPQIVKAALVTEPGPGEGVYYYLLLPEVSTDPKPVLKDANMVSPFSWDALVLAQLQEKLFSIEEGTVYVKVQKVHVQQGRVDDDHTNLRLVFYNGKLKEIKQAAPLPHDADQFSKPVGLLLHGDLSYGERLIVKFIVNGNPIFLPFGEFHEHLTMIKKDFFPVPFSILRNEKEIGTGKVTLSHAGFLELALK